MLFKFKIPTSEGSVELDIGLSGGFIGPGIPNPSPTYDNDDILLIAFRVACDAGGVKLDDGVLPCWLMYSFNLRS